MFTHWAGLPWNKVSIHSDVHIFTCSHAYNHACTHTRMHARTHARTHAHTHTHTNCHHTACILNCQVCVHIGSSTEIQLNNNWNSSCLYVNIFQLPYLHAQRILEYDSPVARFLKLSWLTVNMCLLDWGWTQLVDSQHVSAGLGLNSAGWQSTCVCWTGVELSWLTVNMCLLDWGWTQLVDSQHVSAGLGLNSAGWQSTCVCWSVSAAMVWVRGPVGGPCHGLTARSCCRTMPWSEWEVLLQDHAMVWVRGPVGGPCLGLSERSCCRIMPWSKWEVLLQDHAMVWVIGPVAGPCHGLSQRSCCRTMPWSEW